MDADLEQLARRVGAALQARNFMLSTAESCTGGWIAQTLTAIAGSSAWFESGVVSYSNRSKQALLGVRADTLTRCGAVSAEVAVEMAEGARLRSGAQAALSVTGIAGPGGGSPAKPVGMVCFGWTVEGRTCTRTVHFDGDREQVRRQAVIAALEGLLLQLKG